MKAGKQSTAAKTTGLIDASFGNVTVRLHAATPEEAGRGVEASSRALGRLAVRLGKPLPGPKLAPNVPRFFVDPRFPDWVIRELTGRLSAGEMVDGKFVVNRAATTRVRATPHSERRANARTGT